MGWTIKTEHLQVRVILVASSMVVGAEGGHRRVRTGPFQIALQSWKHLDPFRST